MRRLAAFFMALGLAAVPAFAQGIGGSGGVSTSPGSDRAFSVCPSGCEYSDIGDAVSAACALTPDPNNPATVYLSGVVDESPSLHIDNCKYLIIDGGDKRTSFISNRERYVTAGDTSVTDPNDANYLADGYVRLGQTTATCGATNHITFRNLTIENVHMDNGSNRTFAVQLGLEAGTSNACASWGDVVFDNVEVRGLGGALSWSGSELTTDTNLPKLTTQNSRFISPGETVARGGWARVDFNDSLILSNDNYCDNPDPATVAAFTGTVTTDPNCAAALVRDDIVLEGIATAIMTDTDHPLLGRTVTFADADPNNTCDASATTYKISTHDPAGDLTSACPTAGVGTVGLSPDWTAADPNVDWANCTYTVSATDPVGECRNTAWTRFLNDCGASCDAASPDTIGSSPMVGLVDKTHTNAADLGSVPAGEYIRFNGTTIRAEANTAGPLQGITDTCGVKPAHQIAGILMQQESSRLWEFSDSTIEVFLNVGLPRDLTCADPINGIAIHDHQRKNNGWPTWDDAIRFDGKIRVESVDLEENINCIRLDTQNTRLDLQNLVCELSAADPNGNYSGTASVVSFNADSNMTVNLGNVKYSGTSAPYADDGVYTKLSGGSVFASAASVNPGAATDACTALSTVAVKGAEVGDICNVTATVPSDDTTYDCYVSSAEVVTPRYCVNGSSIDPAETTLVIEVRKP